MKISSVAVIGLGLIGGSLCKALREKGAAAEIVGIDKDQRTIDFARESGIIDIGFKDLNQKLDSQIVVVCTYVDTIAGVVRKALPLLSDGVIITDTGSVKSKVVYEIESFMPPEKHFVGSHPIAGGENPGIHHSDGRIFEKRLAVITPTENSSEKAISIVDSLWREIGSETVLLDTDTHDKIFAYVSHLPHVVAYALINAVAGSGIKDNIAEYIGGGLRDYTRIAASSPEMWTSIFLQNRQNVLEAIEKLKLSINELESAIEKEDLNSITDVLKRAQSFKKSV